MTPVLGQDVLVALWVGSRLNTVFSPPFTAIGYGSNGELVAGAVFNDYVPGGNIEMTLASDRPFSRGMFRSIAGYVFGQLDCARLTVRTRHRNVAGMAKRFGFTREAMLRDYYGPDDHAELFRLLKKDCTRWLE